VREKYCEVKRRERRREKEREGSDFEMQSLSLF